MATVPAGASDERILSLDVIRGIAVMGIFSVNVVDFALIQAAYLNPAAAGGATGVDLGLWFANHVLVDEKMRTLFSILFGASSVLVIDRATAKGESGARVHFARMVVLFALGLAHFYLVWIGDILASYAFTGMAAYLFVRREVKTILIWAACLLSLNAGLFAAGSWHFRTLQQKVETKTANADELKSWTENVSRFAIPDPKRAQWETATYRSGWAERTGRRFAKEKFQPFGGVAPFFMETLGLMLIGIAGLRTGFLTGEWPRPAYVRIAAAGIAIGVAFSIASGAALVSTGFPPWLLLGANYGFGAPAHIGMALGYAALIIVLINRAGRLTARIAAVGRAAFTNYLGTSLIGSLIFYGDGLALFGRLSRAEAWAVAVPAVWALMLLWSKPWLERFNYGPFEWLWRSLARGRLQPMRRQPLSQRETG